MKKYTLWTIILLVVVLAFIACDNNACTHEWDEWTVVTAATCTTQGEEARTCIDCNKAETRPVAINPNAHQWGNWTQTKAPTIAEDGEEIGTCVRCGKNETRIVTIFLRSIDEVVAYLAGTAGGTSTDDPLPLTVELDLRDNGWKNLLSAISKFVALDLSRCTIDGNVFDPDPAISYGKWYIVSLVLPDAAEYIAEGRNNESPFKGFNTLTTVEGRNVKSIPEYAFYFLEYYWYNLTSVSFPAATEIGHSAFYLCTSLISVDFPMVTSIGHYAFTGCTSLTSVDFPAATEINGFAFTGCTSLTSVDFPAVTSIGFKAFGECTNLTSANFPAMSEDLDLLEGYYLPFHRCVNLTSVTWGTITLDREYLYDLVEYWWTA